MASSLIMAYLGTPMLVLVFLSLKTSDFVWRRENYSDTWEKRRHDAFDIFDCQLIIM